MDEFEITKREILASVSIVAILLLIGILISGKTSEYQADKNERYNKAIKIDSTDIFEYGMRTNVGNAFVYGELKAVDTVTYPEIGGSYMYVKKVEEHYNEHARQVPHTRTVNGKTETYYTTETYWSWDYEGNEKKKCKEVTFLGVKFESNNFDIPGSSYIDTIKKSRYVRYKYYGVKTKYKGTIFTELKDKTISKNTPFYKDMTIDKAEEMLESHGGILVIFWVGWVGLIAACVYGFFYIDNKWLE